LILKIRYLSLLLIVLLGSLVTSSAIAAKPSRIIDGANLDAYKPPTKSQCNIQVPSQYPTIQAGIDAAVAGDTVCVGPGKFNENVTINKSLRLSGRGASKTTINGKDADASDSALYVAGDGDANNVIVEGFLIHGVDSVDVNRNDPTAVNIGPATVGAILRNNRIVAGNAELAVRADSFLSNSLITNNVFVGKNSPELFKVSGVQGPSGKVDFLNNTFTGTVDSTTPNQSGSGTVLDTWATNSLIQQNVFDAKGAISILISSAYSSNTVTENNLNSKAAVKVGTYSGGTLSAENNWWGNVNPSNYLHGDIDFTPLAMHPFTVN